MIFNPSLFQGVIFRPACSLFKKVTFPLRQERVTALKENDRGGRVSLTGTPLWCGPPPSSTAAGWWRARCNSCRSARHSPTAAA